MAPHVQLTDGRMACSELGLTGADVDQILVGNPRALFTHAAAQRVGAHH
jgi:hypothetical protein